MGKEVSYAKVEKNFERDGRKIRFTNVIDDAAIEFERALIANSRFDTYTETTHKTEINLLQSTRWLKHSKDDFRLLQVTDKEGKSALQIAFVLCRSNAPGGDRADVPTLGCSFINPEEKYFGLQLIRELFKDEAGISRLRIYPYRPNYRDLLDFELRARRIGFKLAEPMGVTRTAFMDLTKSAEEIITALDKKTRAKIRHHSREQIEIREIKEVSMIPQLDAALQASFQRTKGGLAYYDFEAAIRVVNENPDHILIQGLFFKDKPDQLMAYTINYRNGDILEAVSAGSLSDPRLRSMPFNYFLVWEQVLWAQQHGCTKLDMGGTTDAGPGDTLAGITEFKHRFTKSDLEVGREMEIVLKPAKNFLFNFLIALKRMLIK